MSVSFENRRLAREARRNLRDELGLHLTDQEERDLGAYFQQMDEPQWWWCPNCSLEFEEPYCDVCGKNLVQRIDRAAGEPTEGNPAAQTGEE